MAGSLDYLEGKKLCVVFVQVLDAAKGRVRLQCFRGRANVEHSQVQVIGKNGQVFPVPGSAVGNILPSDGTDLLRDEPVQEDHLAPGVELLSFRALKRVCNTCCDPVECVADGVLDSREMPTLPACPRRP